MNAKFPIKVCGIAGSLRAESYNRALLRAAVEPAPKGMDIRLFERLAEVPLYSRSSSRRPTHS